ncbi:ABC transporter, permease/ATP-binding protein [mine drainage metagenome]|uniref:ABC transporter, permease/ATP-binding protein n=1 Tax=mine drainage metagenome TaxID=410659 RepID=T1C016_9ZZZZ
MLLARALHRQPRFLVLDETTSHSDLANERGADMLVQQLHITRIVLAHRPETLIAADRAPELRRPEIKPTACGLLRAHTAWGG